MPIHAPGGSIFFWPPTRTRHGPDRRTMRRRSPPTLILALALQLQLQLVLSLQLHLEPALALEPVPHPTLRQVLRPRLPESLRLPETLRLPRSLRLSLTPSLVQGGTQSEALNQSRRLAPAGLRWKMSRDSLATGTVCG